MDDDGSKTKADSHGVRQPEGEILPPERKTPFPTNAASEAPDAIDLTEEGEVPAADDACPDDASPDDASPDDASPDSPDPGSTDAASAAEAYQAQAEVERAPPRQRVMQVLAGAHHGGAELFFERLVIALHEEGLTQRAVIGRDSDRAGRLEAAGVEVVQLPFGGWFDFVTRPAMVREIQDFRPDLVISYMSRAASSVPASVPGHDFVHVARLGGYYHMKYYRTCDHLIGISRDLVRSFIERGWPPERAHHITNYVEAEIAEPVPRAMFNTPDDHDILLGLGRLHRNKGFDIAINAMPLLPRCTLWIAGEGPERRSLTKLAETQGVADRVRFLGWRDDVPALLAAADLFVCSSRHEPLGSIVIEAWAHSTPMVALASQGPSELITDGETGLLVPLENPPALARAIQRVLKDATLYDHLVLKGSEIYEKHHTRRVLIDRYLEFIPWVTGEVREVELDAV